MARQHTHSDLSFVQGQLLLENDHRQYTIMMARAEQLTAIEKETTVVMEKKFDIWVACNVRGLRETKIERSSTCVPHYNKPIVTNVQSSALFA